MQRAWRQYVECSARFVSLSPPHVISRLLRNLTFQVLVAVSLGILLGVVAPDTAKSLKPLGDTFINLVKMVITPIIFLTIVHGIASYPTYMTFFSTAERIAIGGVPFLVATDKPTRRDALAYYRGVASMYDVPVRQYEAVESMRPVHLDPPAGAAAPTRAAQWLLRSVKRSGEVMETAAHAVADDGVTDFFGDGDA